MCARKAGETIWSEYGLHADKYALQIMERPDRHNDIEINYLETGSVTYLFGGRPFTLPRKTLVVFWAVVPHQIVHFEGTDHHYWASVPLAWFLQWGLPELLTREVLDGNVVIDSSSERADVDLPLMKQWAKDLKKKQSEADKIVALEIEARMRRLAQTCSPMGASNSPRMESKAPSSNWGGQKAAQMAGYVARNYNKPLKAEQIAESVDLHPNYAMTLFRRSFGVSMIDYVNQHRISHAQRLLATTDEKILTIALESGFHSLSWFNAAFKQQTGQSPRAYRTGVREQVAKPRNVNDKKNR